MKVNQPKVLKIGDKVWVKNEEIIHRGWVYTIKKYLPNSKVKLSSPSGLGRIVEVHIKDVFKYN